MAQRSVVMIGSSLVVASLALSACGNRDSGTTGTTGGGGSGDKVAKIGITAPLTGDLSALGLGIQHSVELAVKEANEKKVIPGWKLETSSADDEGKPDVGKNAATKLAGDEQVVGVVGNLNSSVSQQTQPVFSTAGIAQVSPANTNPSLSNDGGKRLYETYFRTCTTDAVQGPFAAQYMLEKGMKSMATVNDKKTYGQGLASAFEGEFKKGGGKIVASQTINADDTTKDYTSVITALKPLKPQAVYYGGEYPQAGPLSQQMKSNGLSVPLMGGDGIFDPKFIDLAGKSSDGDLATSVGAPTDSSEAGKAFLAAYEKEGYKDPSSAYGGYSYDAANAIIDALKISLKDAKDAKSARPGTVKALGDVSFDGVTGKVGFDKFGDAVSKVLTVYVVKGGKWAADKTGEFK